MSFLPIPPKVVEIKWEIICKHNFIIIKEYTREANIEAMLNKYIWFLKFFS